eukprot:TRINITY_DN1931_c0_g1_i13.p2 TRINITY_DN1931_c0_g1~~TRINITY_DN1931_c0_g1_i13.p2  ORF type:complete len:122 (-),score=21.48 TRINITY_DN1931_c0_g1_i13:18-383(-)
MSVAGSSLHKLSESLIYRLDIKRLPVGEVGKEFTFQELLNKAKVKSLKQFLDDTKDRETPEEESIEDEILDSEVTFAFSSPKDDPPTPKFPSPSKLQPLSLIHICRCRRYAVCRSRWSPYH